MRKGQISCSSFLSLYAFFIESPVSIGMKVWDFMQPWQWSGLAQGFLSSVLFNEASHHRGSCPSCLPIYWDIPSTHPHLPPLTPVATITSPVFKWRGNIFCLAEPVLKHFPVGHRLWSCWSYYQAEDSTFHTVQANVSRMSDSLLVLFIPYQTCGFRMTQGVGIQPLLSVQHRICPHCKKIDGFGDKMLHHNHMRLVFWIMPMTKLC